jgi:Putative S-adenosyl-L-methionine-dependent methyltransferase
MCWDLVTIKKDRLNGIGAAFFRKPLSNECYIERRHQSPPMCEENDDPNAAWYKIFNLTINPKPYPTPIYLGLKALLLLLYKP